MTKVKICGLMRMQDVEAVNIYKPDYIGLIFAPSRRRLSIAQAKALCGALDKDILRVGVFVGERDDIMAQVRAACGLDVLQVYRNDWQCGIGGTVWRGIRVKDETSLAQMTAADAYLLDTYHKDAYGGTGEAFDWQLARQASERGKVVLAGGLTPGNVQDAIRAAQPFAVDVSSGVETDGRKDPHKIRDFIDRARSAV